MLRGRYIILRHVLAPTQMMKPKKLVFAAALAAVIVYAVHMYRKRRAAAKPAVGPAPAPAPKKEGLASRPDYAQKAFQAPYTAIQNQIDEVRGNPDATAILDQGREAIAAYRRSQADVSPEDIMHAERAAWGVAAEADHRAPFNTEKMFDQAADTMQHFEGAPAIDYQTMVQDLVIDPRTRENHNQWVEEMAGWTGTTTMKVDSFEPQLYLNWQGLRMPQAGVGQYNPLQLTEVDDSMLAVNKPFHFNS